MEEITIHIKIKDKAMVEAYLSKMKTLDRKKNDLAKHLIKKGLDDKTLPKD